jgi:hypothetical protein
MQQTNGVAVLATHLAHTDRRALSQAWYSALHLADHTPPPPPRARLASAASSPAHEATLATRTARGATAEHPAVGARDRRTSSERVAARSERSAQALGERAASPTVVGPRRDAHTAAAERRGPTELARRIERGLAQQRAPHAGAASFTIQAAGGRVHIVVRSNGDRTRVVAVCAPPLRERVERALAHVRFALAGSGVLAEVA